MFKVDPRILAQIKKVRGKRAQVVINHILNNGHITTEELEKLGYSHPPRAVRDVRENGVPIITRRIKASSGKSIAIYEFGDPSTISNFKLGGRKVFSKEFKDELININGNKCAICNESYEKRYLQIDHRVPYEVMGDVDGVNQKEDFMLVCASCNRKKSWSCEHCVNWQNQKNTAICRQCFWAHPNNFKHVCLKEIRIAEVTWSGNEIKVYEYLKENAKSKAMNLNDYIKLRLKELSSNKPAE